MIMNLPVPFPDLKKVSSEWWTLFLCGAIIGYKMRQKVAVTDPHIPLLGLDWGLFLGTAIFYVTRTLKA